MQKYFLRVGRKNIKFIIEALLNIFKSRMMVCLSSEADFES